MAKQIGTKQIIVNGQAVTVRFFASTESPKSKQVRYEPNEDMVNDDGQELNGLVMPLRSEVNPTFKA